MNWYSKFLHKIAGKPKRSYLMLLEKPYEKKHLIFLQGLPD